MRQQAYLDIATARDVRTFRDRLIRFSEDMEFPLINAILVVEQPSATPAFMSVGNTPTAYEEVYSDPALSRCDPVMKRLKTLAHPFTYDQDLYVNDGEGARWEHQARFGYRTGVAMAMHMPAGKHLLLGVDREKPLPTRDRELTRLLADLQLLGAFAQEAAVRLLAPAVAAGEVPRLSSREREVLQWTRDGKAAGVIADILNINIGTVNFHLRSAWTKLGVAGKHAAVVKAMQLGLMDH
jgi:DNA-binding CsgD family transcriptional regulator